MKIFKLVEFTINGNSGVIIGDFSSVASVYSFEFDKSNIANSVLSREYESLSLAIIGLLELSQNGHLVIRRIDDFAAPIFNAILEEGKHKRFVESLDITSNNTIPIIKKVG